MTLTEITEEDDFNSRKILFERLKEQEINIEGINDETQLRNISGLDSLGFLQINMDIEEKHNIKLDIIDYDERSTLGDWIKYIEKRKGNYEQ